MTCRMTWCALTLTLVASGGGCTAHKPGLGFDRVQSQVEDRIGRQLYWSGWSPDAKPLHDMVDALLSGELESDEAVQVALLNNRGLVALYEDLNISQADVVRAGTAANPVFAGEVRFGTDGSGATIGLELAQEFVRLLSMPLHRGRAQASFEAVQLRVTAAVLDTAFEVRTTFYEYQGATQAVGMRRSVVDAMVAAHELAARLRAAGNTREVDLLYARSALEQARLDQAAAEAHADQMRERLNSLMGLWGEQSRVWRAVERLPGVPPDPEPEREVERRAVEASLDLAVLRKEAEIAARSAQIATPFGSLHDAEAGAAGEREPDGAWSVGPTLSVPVPVFDRGGAASAEAEARYRQAIDRLAARAVEVRAGARAAEAAARSAHARVRYYEEVILPLREQILQQTQLLYNAMQVSAFQLLRARQDQIASAADYLQASLEYWQARAALDHVLRGRTSTFTPRWTGPPTNSSGGGDGGHP
jgi:outer membrane protein, heavy metal efflux system